MAWAVVLLTVRAVGVTARRCWYTGSSDIVALVCNGWRHAFFLTIGQLTEVSRRHFSALISRPTARKFGRRAVAVSLAVSQSAKIALAPFVTLACGCVAREPYFRCWRRRGLARV